MSEAKNIKYPGFANELKNCRRMVSRNAKDFYAMIPESNALLFRTFSAYHTWELGTAKPDQDCLMILLKFFAKNIPENFHEESAQKLWRLCGYGTLDEDRLGKVFPTRKIYKPDLRVVSREQPGQVTPKQTSPLAGPKESGSGRSALPSSKEAALPNSRPLAMELGSYPGWITGLAWSPDTQYVAAITAPGMSYNLASLIKLTKLEDYKARLLVYSFNNSQLFHEEIAHTGWGDCIDWSSDKTWLASGGQDNQVHLWNFNNWQSHLLSAHSARVLQVRFHPFEMVLASIDRDGWVILWDVLQKKMLTNYRLGNNIRATSLAWSNNGAQLLVGGLDGCIYLLGWSEKGLVESKRMTGLAEWIYALTVSPDDKQVASRGQSNTIKIWEIGYPGPIEELQKHTDTINSLEWSPRSPYLASASDDGTIMVWETSKWQVWHILSFTLKTSGWDRLPWLKDLNFRRWVRTLRWSPDGKSLAGADNTGRILVWKIE